MFECKKYTELDNKWDIEQKEGGSLKKRCGDIFLDENESFIIVCTCCNVFYSNFEDFSRHFIESYRNSHFINGTDTDEDIEDICFVNCEDGNSDDDDEMHIPISKLQSINSSKNKSKFNCKICKNPFSKKSDLEIHVRKHHPLSQNITIENEFDGDKSDFHEIGSIQNNVKKKMEEYPFKCTLCNRNFKNETSLEVHELIHQSTVLNDNNYKCIICEKEINNKAYVRHLQIIHRIGAEDIKAIALNKKCGDVILNDRQKFIIICIYCNMFYSNIKEFTSHFIDCFKNCNLQNCIAVDNESVDDDELHPFKCALCRRSFKIEAHLEIHELIHQSTVIDNDVYKCIICEQKINQKSYVRHLQSFHRLGVGNTRDIAQQKACGDIFINENQSFVIVCICCTIFYPNFEDFTRHFIESCRNSKNVNNDAINCGETAFNENDDLDTSIDILQAINTCKEQHSGDEFSSDDEDLINVQGNNKKKKEKEERPFKCTLCRRNFKSETSLEVHELIHQSAVIDNETYECVICEKGISHKSYVRHLYQFHHIGAKEFECRFCDKKFLYNTEKNVHERNHTGEKPFLCTICGKSFKKSSRLTEHTRRHSGLKPYKCQFCPKTFVAKRDQNRHESIHTGEKPFQCMMCNATFSRKNVLRRHMNLHSDVPKYFCKVCGQGFKQDSSLYKHMKYKKHKCEVSNQNSLVSL